MSCNRLLWIYIHENCERINNVESLNILHLNYSTKPFLILWPAPAFGQTLGASDFSCAVSGFGQSREMNTFVIDVESQ